jgi:hypothetical protein
MRNFALLTTFAIMSACVASAGALDITIHDTTPPTINLSTIVGVWGTPGTGGLTFTPTTNYAVDGTNLFGALNLVDDKTTISSIDIYAFGSIAGSSLNPSCTDGSGFNVNWTCTAPTDPGLNKTLTSPIEWIFTSNGSDDVNLNDIFKIVDTSGGATGAKLIWNLEINGIAPPSPTATPEPSALIPLIGGMLAMVLLVTRRGKSPAALTSN